MHIRFDVRYLENYLQGTRKYLMRLTDTQVVGYRLRKMLDTRSVMVQYYYKCKKTCSNI